MATDYPVTMAIRALRQHKVDFTPHLYTWEARGGTRASAEHLGVDEHQVVKTLIFEDDAKRPLCILMHGDREVSAKNLARQLGRRVWRRALPGNDGGSVDAALASRRVHAAPLYRGSRMAGRSPRSRTRCSKKTIA